MQRCKNWNKNSLTLDLSTDQKLLRSKEFTLYSSKSNNALSSFKAKANKHFGDTCIYSFKIWTLFTTPLDRITKPNYNLINVVSAVGSVQIQIDI